MDPMAVVAIILCAAAGMYIGIMRKFLGGLILGIAGVIVIVTFLPEPEAVDTTISAVCALVFCAILGMAARRLFGDRRS